MADNKTDTNQATSENKNIEESTEEELKSKSIDIKEIFNKISNYIKEGKYILPIFVWITIVVGILMTGVIIKTLYDVKNLNARSQELNNLKNYNTSILNTNSYTKAEINDAKNIEDLIDFNIKLQEDDKNFEEYLKWIQAPYDNFLTYIFLPNLNIWKDPFLWDIDYSIIWLKYLEKNPYDDIALMDRRSNFIKDVWTNNEYNEIESITIWWMVEEWENFYIPISISYTAPSYRWFLLLVEKLSTTSNQKSISLINELIYNIREIIKQRKADEILTIQETYTWFSQDKAIWINLYKRIKWETESSLIDDDIIIEAIRKIAICQNESEEYCYYKFRNKYRNLPSIAYKIWLEWSWNKTEMLKEFLQWMPQIIKITTFTYDWEWDWQEVTDIAHYIKKQYKWSIEFRIYWKWLSNEEVTEIQKLLWDKCLWTDLTPKAALDQIWWKLASIWNDRNIDTYSTIRLMELQNLVTEISNSFDSLSNYKKVVRTFEIYRMLNEWNICNL